MSERENNEEVYLSPESVSSRIRSINEEIKSRMRMNQEEMSQEGRSVHERTARRYEESMKNHEGPVRVEPEVPKVRKEVSEVRREVPEVRREVGNRAQAPTTRNPFSTSSSKSSSVKGSISIDGRIGSPFLKKAFHPEDPVHETPPPRTVNSSDGKVRELIQNFSCKLPSKEGKKNPFTKGSSSRVTTNPFFTKKKDPASESSPVNKEIKKDPAPVRDDLSVLSQNSNTHTPSPFSRPIILTPINVLYTPKHPPFMPRKTVPSPTPKKVFNKTLSFINSYYGPGEELTQDIRFSIINTIYSFSKDTEDSVYYFRVESNISWIIRKTLSQIRAFLKNRVLDESYNPFDKKVRDNIILTILNTVGKRPEASSPTSTCTTDDLQHFILTDITKGTEKRSNFLLMMGLTSLEPFNFRLVGQALVCYDKNNRVNKLFLLKGSSVEPLNEYSFRISSSDSSVVLYSSCLTERDSWVEDILDFIKCVDNKSTVA